MDRREFLMEIVAVAGGLAVGNKLTETQEAKPKTEPHTYTVQVSRADVPNGNKRIYPRHILEREVRKFQCDHKKTRSFMGHMGMPTSSVIELKNVSHVVTDMRMEGDYLVADIEVVNTPCGQILAKLLKENRDIVAFRTAGVGNVICDENGVMTIKDSFKLISINAVPAKDAAKI